MMKLIAEIIYPRVGEQARVQVVSLERQDEEQSDVLSITLDCAAKKMIPNIVPCPTA